MFFEGSEKKFELCVRSGSPGLRSRGEDFWKEVVHKSKAQILSKISNLMCDAYLLSESSLFVWDDQVTMITCGKTELVQSALYLLETIEDKDLETFFFERKNEYFPQYQKTDFFDDRKLFNQKLSGKSLRFGNPDEHHLFLYHLDKPFKPVPTDVTLEVLLYHLEGPSREIFTCENQSLKRIHEVTKIHELFEGFIVDEYLFSPCGYSLNALRGREYYTVHVTPQEDSSYVSIETNVRPEEGVANFVSRLIEAFRPNSFDVVQFQTEAGHPSLEIPGFRRKQAVSESISCGYELQFASFYKPVNEVISAHQLEEGPNEF